MNCCIDNTDSNDNSVDKVPILRSKIPRPPNAFMLYANEHRKTLAHLYPADSNKEISRRLGQTWKELSLHDKGEYFQRAKAIDMEHKRKYPGYVYNPKDARMRKAIRSTLKDRNVGGFSGMTSRAKRENENDNIEPIIWTSYCDPQQTFHRPNDRMQIFEGALPLNLMGSTDEEKKLFEKEKSYLEFAESYTKNSGNEEFAIGNYPPISSTKFIRDPELFTNNVEYHKEYIIKYFSHIPDYEIYNVTTEDGFSFPYVTLPNVLARQNVALLRTSK